MALQLNKTPFTLRLRRMAEAVLLAATTYGWQGEPAYSTDSKITFICDADEGVFIPVVERWRADQATDVAPNDDTTPKVLTLQKLASPPANAAYIAFSNNPGSDVFYLVLEEG